MADALFEVRTSFALGNWQAVVQEAEAAAGAAAAAAAAGGGAASSASSEASETERRVLLYRAFVAQGKPEVVLGELPAPQGLPLALRAVGLLAAFQMTLAAPAGAAREQQQGTVLAMLAELVAEAGKAAAATPAAASAEEGDPTPEADLVAVLAATIYLQAGDLEAAQKAVYNSNNLEARALLVQVYLLLERADVAEKEVREMQRLDDDSTWTQLSIAAAACASSTATADRLLEAAQIYEELIGRYGPTPKLLNGLAVAQMLQGEHQAAQKSLLSALEKDPRHGDTLANIVTVSAQLGKAPDFVERQVRMLASEAPNHPLLAARAKADADFDAEAASFAPAKGAAAAAAAPAAAAAAAGGQ